MTIAKALEAECARLGLPFDPAWVPGITAHLQLLERWAPRINLTTVSRPSEAVTRHVVDSLALLALDVVRQAAGQAADIGSGAGFPGIPLAIARPELTWTLVEPRAKRGTFLTQVLAASKTTNARWLGTRLPDPALEGRFSLVVSRATFPPPELLGHLRPLLTDGGAAVMMTAEDPRLSPDDWTLEQAVNFDLDGAPRWLGAWRPTR